MNIPNSNAAASRSQAQKQRSFIVTIKGKVALVTGASSGIGEAIARALAAEGVKVGLAARCVDKLKAIADDIRSAGGDATTIELDVTDPDQNAAAVDRLVTECGGLDIAVLIASLMPLSDIDSLKTDERHRMVDVNIKVVLNTTEAVLPTFTKERCCLGSLSRLT